MKEITAKMERDMSNVAIYWVIDVDSTSVQGDPWDNPDGPERWMRDNGVRGFVAAAAYGPPVEVEIVTTVL